MYFRCDPVTYTIYGAIVMPVFHDNRAKVRTSKPRLTYVNGEYLAWFNDAQICLAFDSLRAFCRFASERLNIR